MTSNLTALPARVRKQSHGRYRLEFRDADGYTMLAPLREGPDVTRSVATALARKIDAIPVSDRTVERVRVELENWT